MKQKFGFLNLIALAAVLFSVLFQSAHSVEHIAAEFNMPKCHHDYTHNKHELTHQHHRDDNCFVCHFSFASFITADIFSLQPKKFSLHNGYAYARSREITAYFRGSLFSHRGPPSIIV
jgi:hypothetical protein